MTRLVSLCLVAASGLGCASSRPLTIHAAGEPKTAGILSLAPGAAEMPPGMSLSSSADGACFDAHDGSRVCPTRGAPLRTMPPRLRPDAAPSSLARSEPEAAPPGHPACFSGSHSVPCDETFALSEDPTQAPTAVAEEDADLKPADP